MRKDVGRSKVASEPAEGAWAWRVMILGRSLVVLVWGAAVVAATECEGASVSETLLYSGVALAVAAGLLTPLMMKYRWTTHWWHVVSLLLMLTFMAWQLAMPCGAPPPHVCVGVTRAHVANGAPLPVLAASADAQQYPGELRNLPLGCKIAPHRCARLKGVLNPEHTESEVNALMRHSTQIAGLPAC